MVFEPRKPFLGCARIAEDLLEQHAWIVFCRQRSGGSSPGKSVLIDAAVTAVASTCCRGHVLDCQLQRWERRILADLGCDPLVDGGVLAEVRRIMRSWRSRVQPHGTGH